MERVRSNAIQYNRVSRKEVSERLLFGSLCDVVDAILVFFFFSPDYNDANMKKKHQNVS